MVKQALEDGEPHPLSPATPATRAALYDGFAAVGKALSAGRRLEILDLVVQAPRSVSRLASELQQSVANISQHVQVLTAAGLVTTRREGAQVICAPSRPEVGELLSLVRDIAADELGDVRQLLIAHLGDRDDVEWISSQELVRRMRRGDIIVVDVRPPGDFRAGHISGAVQLTSDQVPAFARTVPEVVEVVAYCRSQYCSLADDAVRELSRLGVRARRLEDGFPEWERSGRPVDAEAPERRQDPPPPH